MLPRATLTTAMTVVEQARVAVQEECGIDGMTEQVTISIGVVAAPRGTHSDQALQAADAHLYEAKASGRNAAVGGDMPSDPPSQ